MQLITKKDLATKLNMTLDWIEQAIPKGLIPPPIELDGHMRWREKDIDRWIQSGCHTVEKSMNFPSEIQSSEKYLSLKEIEREAIIDTLRITDNNRAQTARLLGIAERTLYRKIGEYGLEKYK